MESTANRNRRADGSYRPRRVMDIKKKLHRMVDAIPERDLTRMETEYLRAVSYLLSYITNNRRRKADDINFGIREYDDERFSGGDSESESFDDHEGIREEDRIPDRPAIKSKRGNC